MSAKISVAMATFNGEQYIRDQLNSLKDQTLAPFELVVTDDGSTDNTLAIVREFARTAPFSVRIFENSARLGFIENFFKAASLCCGEWIAFCDQDDVWMPKKIETVARVAAEVAGQDVFLIGHSSLLADSGLKLTGQRLPDFQENRVTERSSQYGFFCIVGFSLVCDSKLLTEFPPGLRPQMAVDAAGYPLSHDQWLPLLGNVLGGVAFIAEPLAIWRRHELALTRPPESQNLLELTGVSVHARVSDYYMHQARNADDVAQVLGQLAQGVRGSIFVGRLQFGAAHFGRLAVNLRARAGFYQSRGFLQRLGRFLGLMFSGAYFGKRIYAFGWRSFGKDVIYVTNLLPVFKALLRPKSVAAKND